MRHNTAHRFGLVLVFLTLLAALPVAVPSVAAATSHLVIHENSATSSFPESISFRLNATAPGPVTRIETRYRAAYAPVTQVLTAEPPGGSEVDVVNTLNTRIDYLPPGIDIIYRWRLTLLDGSVVETPDQTLFHMDNRYDWIKRSQDQVDLFYYAGNQEFGDAALSTVTTSIKQFKERFSLSAEEPVRVVIYGSHRDFAGALPANSSEWIGGFADPTLHLVVTGIDPGRGALTEMRRTLTHEVVHLIVAQATDNPFNTPPAWLDEGLATYYQEIDDPRLDEALQDAVDSGQLIPLRALNSSFPDDPDQALLSYAESESVVRFILEEKGNAQMAALINVFKDGVSYDQAVRQSLGVSLDQLDQEWKAWLDYPGDRQVAGTSWMNDRVDDLVTQATSFLPLALAALFCLGVGIAFLWRFRTADHHSS